MSVVIGTGLLTMLLVAMIAVRAATAVRADAFTMRAAQEARAVVLALDTRSSELKVVGYKAVTVSDPHSAVADVTDDTAKVSALLAQLD
jgi:methyl-accepting chemotaxis protein